MGRDPVAPYRRKRSRGRDARDDAQPTARSFARHRHRHRADGRNLRADRAPDHRARPQPRNVAHRAHEAGATAGARRSAPGRLPRAAGRRRSEEHTSELQSLMRISYAVFCLKKKKQIYTYVKHNLYTHLKLKI